MILFCGWPIVLGLLVPPLAAASGSASDPGRELHDRHCVSCHGTEVYGADKRRVRTRADLAERVAFCAENAAAVQWSEAQIEAVTDYLNQTFYGF